MSKIIEFKNVNFGYNNTNAVNDFNMEIEEGDIISLIGPSGSGKSTLLKMLCHKLPNYYCYYNGTSFKDCNIEELKRSIVVVFDLPFANTTIKEEITRYLKKLAINKDEIDDRYDKFKTTFSLSRLEGKDINKITYSDRTLIKILRYLIIDPSFIAIDSIFSSLTSEYKEKIIDFIKENHITLLNVTTDLDDTLYGNKIYVIENFVLILEGNTLSVLKTDTLLKRLGFKLPLAVDLSIELNHYEVLNKIYTNKDKLVNALWK